MCYEAEDKKTIGDIIQNKETKYKKLWPDNMETMIKAKIAKTAINNIKNKFTKSLLKILLEDLQKMQI